MNNTYDNDLDVVIVRGKKQSVDKVKALLEAAAKAKTKETTK